MLVKKANFQYTYGEKSYNYTIMEIAARAQVTMIDKCIPPTTSLVAGRSNRDSGFRSTVLSNFY